MRRSRRHCTFPPPQREALHSQALPILPSACPPRWAPMTLLSVSMDLAALDTSQQWHHSKLNSYMSRRTIWTKLSSFQV